MSTITTKQCKWILKHQHKLKQVARACSLKVKEALHAPEESTRTTVYEQYESEYTFKYSDLTTKLAEPDQLRAKPEVSELKFGQIFTDHMMKVFYHKRLGGWQKPVIIPFENISLHPAAKVLQYAVELFEGMKAYRGVDGKIRIFRPDLNMARMNMSAQSSGLPTFDNFELIKCINRLVQIDQEWVPHSETSSLYIRPTFIGIDGTLGIAPCESALLYTILCPVSSYFEDGQDAVSLLADPAYTRSWPGGSGDKKVGSNYGPTIKVQHKAVRKGRQQVLWLYGPEHQITEVGTMNMFIYYVNENGEKVLATPPLNGLILPGITRQSILDLAEQMSNIKIEQRTLTMGELINLLDSGRLLEMFGSGTACIISPIASIEYQGSLLEIPTMEHGKENSLYFKFRETLKAIQYGHINHPWGQVIE